MPPFSGYQGHYVPTSGFAPQFDVRQPSPAIPMPQIKLPHFDGAPGTYQGWWESFSVNVHSTGLPTHHKWLLLKDSVQGKAARKIEGLSDSFRNYDDAIAVLQRVYGKESNLQEALIQELANLPPVHESLSNLEDFTDTVRAKSMVLERAGVEQKVINGLTALLTPKLPNCLKAEINRMEMLRRAVNPAFAHQPQQGWKMAELLGILEQFQELSLHSIGEQHKEITPQDATYLAQHTQNKQASKSTAKPDSGKGKASPKSGGGNLPDKGGGKKKMECLFCSGNHYSDTCRTVTDQKKRRDIAIEKKACFKCLFPGHNAEACKREKPCFQCGSKRHHCALCKNKDKGPAKKPVHKPTGQDSKDSNSENSGQKEQQQCLQHLPPVSQLVTLDNKVAKTKDPPIMATFSGVVRNPITGQSQKANIFIDGGGHYTSITLAVRQSLDLNPVGDRVVISTGTFGSTNHTEIQGEEVEFEIVGPTGFPMKLTGLAIETISANLTLHPVQLSTPAQQLADQYRVVNAPPREPTAFPIDVLVGQDHANLLLFPRKEGKVLCLDGSLRIHVTPMGNFLTGSEQCHLPITTPATTMSARKATKLHRSMFCQTALDISSLWSLEQLGITSVDEKVSPAEQFFKDTVQRLEDGRYEVRLPFRPNAKISSNFRVAVKRLDCTLQKLCPNGQITHMYEQYNGIFKEQLERGIIEKVDVESTGKLVHYLAHFPVIKEESQTTKVRIVIDPSVKTREEVSLNDLFYKTPNLVENLLGILLRFRTFRFVLSSDIEKAFLMIGVNPEDRDAVRFLWLKDPTKPVMKDNIQRFRAARVPFGLSCSPWLLLSCLKEHVENNPGPVAETLRHQIYVDNILQNPKSAEESFKLQQATKEFFAEACLNAREWRSNVPGFEEWLRPEDRAKGDPGSVKVLGMIWDSNADTISLKPYNFDDKQSATKRTILQKAATIFDILGLFSPVTIRARIILQELWKANCDWDEILPPELQQMWHELEQDLLKLPERKFPRLLITNDGPPVNLFAFADASPNAYCAAIYVRQDDEASLLFCKAKVAPLKPSLTVPRLELLAMLMAIRLLKVVSKELHMPVQEVHLWSDSQIALHQVLSDKVCEPWVARRVEEIQSLEHVQFHHIPGPQNPADLGTRGVSLKQLEDSDWFQGPEWLSKGKDQWPHFSISTLPADPPELPQVQIDSTALVQNIQKDVESYPMDITRFSSLSRLLRVMAYCLIFIKKSHRSLPLRAASINQARLKWVKLVQQTHFEDTIESIKAQKPNKQAKQLALFLDEDGILRVSGRLANAPLQFGAKFPALLPKNDRFTELVVQDAHHRQLHFKARGTLTQIRQQYWIPSGLSTVKKILKGCTVCRKAEGKCFKPPPMAPLPPTRVSEAPAFRYTAMDYLGPILVQNPTTKDFEKRWIALFTCFATRAVHLEVVSDCSAGATMRAVERFCNRRGCPHVLRTDNQPGFLKAAKGFQEIFNNAPQEEDQFHCFFAKKGIEWTTVPERCASMNGLVERLVGLVKRALRKALWKTYVSPDVFETLITKVEAVINSRPLLQPGTEVEDSCLTPAHFIAPTSQLSLPPWDADASDPDWTPKHLESDLLRNFHQGRHYLEQFWKVFSNSYLQELREAQRLHFKSKPGEANWMPKVGDICLAQEPSAASRMRWPMVRIERLLPGNDGLVRTAQVRLASGHITRRAIKELVPLEARLESELASSDGDLVVSPNGVQPAVDPVKPHHDHVADPRPPGPPHHDNEPVARRTRSALRTAPFLLFLFCMLLPGVQVNAIPTGKSSIGKFQICALGPGGTQLKLPKEVHCEAQTGKNSFSDVNVTIYTPNHEFPKSEAYLCYFEKTTIKASVGFFGGPPVLSIPVLERFGSSTAECQIASVNRTYNNSSLIQDPNVKQSWSTGKKLVVKHSWYSTTVSSVTNFVIEKGEVFSKDGKSITSNLLDTEHCQLKNGICHLKDSTLIWSLKAMGKYCPFIKKGFYEAKLEKSKLFLTVPLLQSAFHLTPRRGSTISDCIPARSFLSYEGPVIYFGFHAGHRFTELQDELDMIHAKSNWKKLQDNLNLTATVDPINAKLAYEFIRLMEAQHSENYFLYCSMTQDWLHFLEQFIAIHPTVGVRAALHRTDICAEIVDEIVVVHQCHPVEPDRIHWDHRHPHTGQCTEYVPVSIGDLVWYITPGTKDLIAHSPIIPCDLISDQFKQKKEAEVHSVVIPNFLPKRHSAPHDSIAFSAPPLYKSRPIFGPQHFQTFVRQSIGQDRIIHGLINYTTEFAIKPGQLKEALEGLGLMGQHLLEGFGQGAGAIIHDSVEGLGSFAGHIIQPLYILLISVTALFALVLIVICYCRFGINRVMREIRARRMDAKLAEHAVSNATRSTTPPESGSKPSPDAFSGGECAESGVF